MPLITHTTRWLEEHDDGRDTYEKIDCSFDHRPCIEEEIHDIEIHICISSYSDESPVQRADEDEYICEEMQTTEFIEDIGHRKWE
jgi:hypothetical protein